jgi:hypothetical protein
MQSQREQRGVQQKLFGGAAGDEATPAATASSDLSDNAELF